MVCLLFAQKEIHADLQRSLKAAVTSVYWPQEICTQRAIPVTVQQALR